ncbi:hypothetical protein AUK40_04475 [Candidatus Wirthbacteria bacterium CG2_30_54_11]|uniref:Glycosyltransferase RgtA/B/C/D-like domain-containing protein n=1 Tax=Candidatus Wirthbacteria bacterium CG2_30_54_11 TaxID=1817892 RepID=A0A1J5IX83_9BACT|nr:MAG: hypothetical protein AUK40_04475 [Candidatus Wirthbacteria bacterium CG2_30_54_11]
MNMHSAVKATRSFGGRHLPWISIALVAGFLRLWRLDVFPPLTGDEDIYLHLANGFFSGRHEMFAIPYSYMPHPPLFFLIGNLFTLIFGSSILVLRTLTALCGIVSCLLIYRAGQITGGRAMGWVAGIALAVMPHAVYFNRLAFGYSLLELFMSLLVVEMLEFVRSVQAGRDRRAVLLAIAAGIVAGAASLVEMGGVALVNAAILLFILFYRRHVFLVGLGAIGIPVIGFGWAFLRSPHWFILDLRANSGRVDQYVLLILVGLFALILSIRPVRRSLLHLWHFTLSFMPWFWLFFGFVLIFQSLSRDLIENTASIYWLGWWGLLILVDASWRKYFLFPALGFLGYQILVDRAAGMLVPLFPLLSLGVAALTRDSFRTGQEKWGRKSTWMRPLFALSAGMVIVISFGQTIDMVSTIRGVTTLDTYSQISAYITTHTRPGDLVIASPLMEGMADRKMTTLTQFMSYGVDFAQHYSTGEEYRTDRYFYPVTSETIALVLIDDTMLQGIRGGDDVPEMFKTGPSSKLREMVVLREKKDPVLSWPTVRIGTFNIFQNPDL